MIPIISIIQLFNSNDSTGITYDFIDEQNLQQLKYLWSRHFRITPLISLKISMRYKLPHRDQSD